MKIAFLSIYNGTVNRGVETVVKELGQRLAKNHEVHVYQNGNAEEEENYKVIQVKVLPVDLPNDTSSQRIRRSLYIDYFSLKILLFTLKILPKLIQEKYDVIIPFNNGWQTVLCVLLKKFHKAKIVVSGQAGPGKDDAWALNLGPDAFIALTDVAFEWSKKAIWRKNINIVKIPNGVDPEKFNPTITPADINLSRPVICCNAALVPYKRVDLVIKAVAKMGNTSLLLIGDGILRDEIDKLGNALLRGKYLRVSVPFEQIPGFYKATDVFTMVSESQEAFGIVYLEAMACGLPVVATDDVSRHEIVGDAGLFVDPTNIDEYAKSLRTVLETNFENKPRLQAEKFDWGKIAIQYSELFSSLLIH